MSDKKPTKNMGGAPIKYKEDMPEKLIEYFRDIKTVSIMGKDFPRFNSVEGFCADYGIAKSTFYVWVKKYPKLSDAFERCKNYQADQLFNLTANRIFSESYGKLLTVNCTDMKEKIEQQVEQSTEIKLSYKTDEE